MWNIKRGSSRGYSRPNKTETAKLSDKLNLRCVENLYFKILNTFTLACFRIRGRFLVACSLD